MLKIWRELPDMYIIIAFMGRALAGARASSQDFLSLRVSVSARVGGLRVGALDEVVERWESNKRHMIMVDEWEEVPCLSRILRSLEGW